MSKGKIDDIWVKCFPKCGQDRPSSDFILISGHF
jgi:hypothetical protein